MSAWTRVPLAEIAQVFNGKTPSKAEQRSDGHPVLKIKDVSDVGDFRGTFDSFVDPDLVDAYQAKRLRLGDTLILNAAHNSEYVGSKMYRVQPAVVGALATGEWLVIRPAESRLDPGFVFHWVNSTEAHRAIRNMVKGIHLYPKDVARLRVPLPPLSEQRRIADILDKADVLRAKRRAALAHLDTLTQSIFLNLFGDPIANPRRFPIKKLIDLVDSQRPITYGILKPGPNQQTGVKYVRVVDMKRAGVALSGIRRTTQEISNSYRRSLLKEGDLLLSIRGRVGRLALVPRELDGANITQDTARLSLRGIDSLFIRECLNTPALQQWMATHTKGVAVRGINLGDVKLMPIIDPPAGEQRQFRRTIETWESVRSAQSRSLDDCEALFDSLQHQAFSGLLSP